MSGGWRWRGVKGRRGKKVWWGEERLGWAGQAVWPTTTEWAHLMSICTYMLIKWVCAVHVCTLLSSCEALMRVSSKLGASISSTPSSRRLSMGKNT